MHIAAEEEAMKKDLKGPPAAVVLYVVASQRSTTKMTKKTKWQECDIILDR